MRRGFLFYEPNKSFSFLANIDAYDFWNSYFKVYLLFFSSQTVIRFVVN